MKYIVYTLLFSFVLFIFLCICIQMFGVRVGYGMIDFDRDCVCDTINCDVYWTLTNSYTVPDDRGYNTAYYYYEPFNSMYYFYHKHMYHEVEMIKYFIGL